MSSAPSSEEPAAAQARDGQSLVRLRAVPEAAQARLAEERARRLLRRAASRILGAAAGRGQRSGTAASSASSATTVPDYRTWTQREYGNRTGIFRVLDVLDRYQIRAGVAVNAMAAERYPYLIEQFKKRKYEFIAHGTSANRMITSKMSEAEEKAEIAASIAAIEKAAGVTPKGWLGPGIRREPAHAASCWPMPASTTCSTGRTTTSPTR